MSNIAVIYKSKYGATKKYATWISEELRCELIEAEKISSVNLQNYDIIIYGGGLYASGIAGIDLLLKNPIKKLVVFTVGLANPETTNYTEILHKNIPLDLRDEIKIFHFRGGIDYKKLSIIHQVMMSMMKRLTIDKKKENELTKDDKEFLNTYKKSADFINHESIYPLISYVKNYLV